MAPVNPPAWQQAGSYPARLDRLTIAGLLTPNYSKGPLVGRSGVKPTGGYTGLQAGPRSPADMYVTVQPGSCFIAATSVLGGSYECHNDGSYDVLISAAHATLSRADLVVARVYDAIDDAGSRNEFAIEVITGTPAVTPVLPSAPLGSIPLASVNVPPGAVSLPAANIADMRQYAVALGGVLPVASQNQRDAITQPYAGMQIYRRDVGWNEMYTGSVWLPVPYASDSGWVTWPYASGFKASGAIGSSPGYRVRQIGGSTRIRLRGAFGNSSDTNFSISGGGVTLGVLPANIHPPVARFGTIATQYTTASTARAQVDNAGNVQVFGPQTVQWVSLDGFEYDLDA